VAVKTRWAIVSALALLGLHEGGCRRKPADGLSFEWAGGGESGADDTGATGGGQSGEGNPGSGGSGGKNGGGTSGASTGGTTPLSTGGATGGGGGRPPKPSGGTAGRGTGGGSAGVEVGGSGGDDPQDAGAGGAAPDPCLDASDSDEDGVTDPCDDDDDDDGYLDVDDLAPLDPFAPGGVVAPGTIINDACVKDVLAELESLSMTMPIHRERFPPEMDGYYVRPAGQGVILAANDGAAIGATTVGMEARVKLVGVDRFDAAVIDFWNGQPTAYAIGSGGWVRGRGVDFTHYAGSGGLVILYSASRGASGSWLDGFYLSILLPTSGLPHVECPTGAGKYRFSSASLTSKVKPAELEFMCVDQNAAFVPTEDWPTGANGRCECTTDYKISCDGS
jgi:hypothetical protein